MIRFTKHYWSQYINKDKIGTTHNLHRLHNKFIENLSMEAR
jgi:hypothetical protein